MAPDFKLSRLEVAALRKLELVSKALAMKLTGTASAEQKCLADVLGEVLDRYEITVASAEPHP